jgi:hypothetical protein
MMNGARQSASARVRSRETRSRRLVFARLPGDDLAGDTEQLMPLTLLLALQAAAAPAPALLAIDFDLASYSQIELGRGRSACRRDDPSAIVVCARRGGGAYPLAERGRIFEPGRIVARTRLTGNLTGDVHGESVALDRGAVSNRAMVRLTLPF